MIDNTFWPLSKKGDTQVCEVRRIGRLYFKRTLEKFQGFCIVPTAHVVESFA